MILLRIRCSDIECDCKAFVNQKSQVSKQKHRENSGMSLSCEYVFLIEKRVKRSDRRVDAFSQLHNTIGQRLFFNYAYCLLLQVLLVNISTHRLLLESLRLSLQIFLPLLTDFYLLNTAPFVFLSYSKA